MTDGRYRRCGSSEPHRPSQPEAAGSAPRGAWSAGGRFTVIRSDRHAAVTNLFANGLILMSAGLSLLLVLGVVLRRALAAPRLPRTAAWILVPGHQLRDGTPSPDFQARLARAATLATRSPNARVLVLGGRGGDGRCSEAAIGRTHLEGLGVPGERIHSEERSRNTLENLQQAAARLGDPCGLPLVLVSNRYHLARCLLMARNLGLPVLGAPAEPTLPFSWRLPWQLLWEAYLVHWYLAGWVYASILGNDAMLERVLNRRGIRKWRS